MSSSDEERGIRLTIGVTTFMRPAGLQKLLRSLNRIDLPDRERCTVDVVIVDNDGDRSAEAVVTEARGWFCLPLRYDVEPRRGIAHARNAVVANAAESDFLVFVDDDEYVTPGWLVHMLDAQRQFDADVVVGPVVPEFGEGAPQWVINGQRYLYHYPRYETGTRLNYGHTGNVLFTRKVIGSGEGSLFDERFGLTGSEDTFLFMQLVLGGAAMYWCDEALVYETVPESRTTLAWLLKRAYSGSNSFAIAERLANPGTRTPLTRAAKGAIRIGAGVVGLPLTLLFGRAHFARMAASMSKGAGMIMGTAGRGYEAYREVPANDAGSRNH